MFIWDVSQGMSVTGICGVSASGRYKYRRGQFQQCGCAVNKLGEDLKRAVSVAAAWPLPIIRRGDL